MRACAPAQCTEGRARGRPVTHPATDLWVVVPIWSCMEFEYVHIRTVYLTDVTIIMIVLGTFYISSSVTLIAVLNVPLKLY